VAGELGAVGEGLFEIGFDKGESGPPRRGYGGDVANACVMAARAGIAEGRHRAGRPALARRRSLGRRPRQRARHRGGCRRRRGRAALPRGAPGRMWEV